MLRFEDLKVDKVFFEASYPILYTCTDGNSSLFLVVCCQNNTAGSKWLVTKTTEENIIQMLSNKITIREAFIKPSGEKFTFIGKDGQVNIKENGNEWDLNSKDLPSSDVFLDPDPEEFDDDIEYYQTRIGKRYSKFFGLLSHFELALGTKADVDLLVETINDYGQISLPDLGLVSVYSNLKYDDSYQSSISKRYKSNKEWPSFSPTTEAA